MRMPNSQDMSYEQQDIYEDAPMDGSVMIVGPPGTGKTVIAFLRAKALRQKKINATVLVYNRVLQQYTSNIANDISDHGVVSNTLLSWFYKWWMEHRIKSKIEINQLKRIYLDCPYDQREIARANGARWDKFKRKWYISYQVYTDNRNIFDQWVNKNIITFEPPMVSDYNYDWNKMLRLMAKRVGSKNSINDWGHIVIDEAQDFPESMFDFLNYVSNEMSKGSITILADENQRLHEKNNSTIEQIKEALEISDNNIFLLTENFRNTKEIAILSAHFYTGLKTGIPKLPINKRGDVPEIYRASSFENQINYIVQSVSNRGYGEIGVFAQNDKIREKIFNILKDQLKGKYTVQTYSSKSSKNVESLIFDKNGTLTVINRQSCKGLEFDAVFIPEIQAMQIDNDNLDYFKMNMYVMCSRARTALCLLYSSTDGTEPEIINHFPDKNSGVLNYIYG